MRAVSFLERALNMLLGMPICFLIEGMARVRKVIEENRKRKLTEPDADCSCCEHKSRCLYRYNAEKNPDRNKVMKNNERWEELREESNANIQKYH